MTASKSSVYAFGAGVCKVVMYLIVIAFLVLLLDKFFYTRPHDRLFALGMAFVLVFMLGRTFRAMARHARRNSGYAGSDYSPDMVPLRARR